MNFQVTVTLIHARGVRLESCQFRDPPISPHTQILPIPNPPSRPPFKNASRIPNSLPNWRPFPCFLAFENNSFGKHFAFKTRAIKEEGFEITLQLCFAISSILKHLRSLKPNPPPVFGRHSYEHACSTAFIRTYLPTLERSFPFPTKFSTNLFPEGWKRPPPLTYPYLPVTRGIN